MTADYSINLLGEIPRLLAENGWHVHLISSPGPELDSEREKGYASCHYIPMARNPSILPDLWALIGWVRVLRTIRPTVVSVGTPKAALLGLLASWALRVPHRVYLLRGLRLETATGVSRVALAALERIASSCATEVIAVSASLKTAYLKEKLVDKRKVIVLGGGSSKGVDGKIYRPAAKNESDSLLALAESIGLLPGVPVIGVFGRQAVDKGLEIFVTASDELLLAGIEHQVLMVGDDESLGRLGNISSFRTDRFVVISRVHDLQRYYRLLTILCLPTLREGLPNVALEAQASSVPVITTDATGAIDSVENRVTGLVVAKGSSDDLVAALKCLLQDEPYRAQLAAKARPWVLRNFDAKHVSDNNLKYFSDLVSKSP